MDLMNMEARPAKRGESFTEGDRKELKASIRKMIEKHMLPFLERKIRSIEINVANTRKGIKNTFKKFWSKSERGENEGLKETFAMNK